ncbi:DUF2087 domain-containing protein [Eubacteriaceae bacterium ES3]|nr:DUF2087 domain-containing protein [Eubacteriaceae bacterium ES3]
MTKANNLKTNINISKFLDERGRINQLPKKKTTRLEILTYLTQKFDLNKDYTEKEVNEMCQVWHTFDDYFILRRELIDYGLLKRTVNGSRYWKPDHN